MFSSRVLETLLLVGFVSSSAAAGVLVSNPPILLNEVVGSTDSNDVEFIELIGAPGTSLDGYSIVIIERDVGNSGFNGFDRQYDFAAGDMIGTTGFFLLGNELVEGQFGVVPDAITSPSTNFIENSSYLVALIKTPPAGSTMYSDIAEMLDYMFVLDTDSGDAPTADDAQFILGDSSATASLQQIGPDGNFLPAGYRRDPDGSSNFVIADFFNTDNTPENGNGGSVGGPSGSPVPIYDIQGLGHTSPFVGQTVQTSGVVTAVSSNKFFLQDPTGDGDIKTSDAIECFTSSAPTVSVGDMVEVTGSVSEFTPGGSSSRNLATTQFFRPAVTVISSGNSLPTPVLIGASGRFPPTEIIDDDAFAAYEPETDGIDFFESLEAMLVTVAAPRAVSGVSRFREIFTVVDAGVGATGISSRGTLNISPDDFNPEKIQIDEDLSIVSQPLPDVDVGAQLSDITGVISYDFGNFQVNPTQPVTELVASSLTPETTSLVGTEDKMSIASYNVLNLDPSDVPSGRFDAIAAHIVQNLAAPDVVALQEIQDNSGPTDDGVVSADETLTILVDAIVAAGGPLYSFQDNTFIINNASGGQPGGNIRVAFLYNSDRVKARGFEPISGQGEGEAFEGARLPLVGKFKFKPTGRRVTVINNHFSSKGGSAAIMGVEQPFEARQEDVTVNGSLDERQRQSLAVQEYVNSLKKRARVVVLGDMNEFEFVSPVLDLESNTRLNNLMHTVPEDERYTFIFQGNSQSLDHILVSNRLVAAGAEFDIVHVNVEFAELSSRASDHEPILALLKMK